MLNGVMPLSINKLVADQSAEAFQNPLCLAVDQPVRHMLAVQVQDPNDSRPATSISGQLCAVGPLLNLCYYVFLIICTHRSCYLMKGLMKSSHMA